MNILKQSKNIIYFEINKEFQISSYNTSFKILFPEFKSSENISLEAFSSSFKYPDSVIRQIKDFLTNEENSLQLQLNNGSILSLELAIEKKTYCLYGLLAPAPSSEIELISNYKNIEFSGDGILLGNLKGEIIYSNKKITEFTGYTENELLGNHISILFQEKELNDKPLRFDLLNNNQELLVKRKLKRKNGSSFHIEMLSKKVNEGYITNIRNIEQRVKTETELEETRQRILFAAKLEKIGIIDHNLTTDAVVFNDEMHQILSLSKQTTYNMDIWLKKIHEDDLERVKEGLEMVEELGSGFQFVYRIKTDDKIKTIKASADILYNESEESRKLIISSIDISNSNELKQRLQELENTFQSLANTATSMIFIYKEKFLYVNKTFEKITGYSRIEAQNMNFWDVIHPDFKELVKERGLKRLKGEMPLAHYDVQIITKNSDVKWVELSAAQIKYFGESAAVGSAFEISKRKELEQEMLGNIQILELEKQKAIESDIKFKEYMLQNTAPMLVLDSQNKKIIFANKAAANLYGYTTEELEKLNIYHLQTISKEDVDMKMKTALHKSSNEFVFTHLKKDQSEIAVRVNASPVKFSEMQTMVLIISDISEELNSKSELIESHSTYKNILNSISDMLYVLNKEGQFLYVNKAAVETYQYEAEEFYGKTPDFLSAPEKNNLEEVAKSLEKAYNGEQNTIYFWGLRKDKSIFPKEVVLSPGYYFGQKVILAVSRDITEHIRITEELTAALEKAEESDKLKSAFLANMSHEIRTPMNAILGFTELIKDAEMDQEERLKFISIINRSSHHLLNLINDLVDLSKIYANQMALEKKNFSLNSMFFEVFELYENEIKKLKKNKDLELTVSFGLPYGKDVIYTDETRLRQLLNNTIGNAIKFTKSGKIHFEYKKQGDHLEFKVTDTGIGIPKDQIKNVFNRFVQADNTISRKYGGTGLGLAISQACAELLDGEIWIESELHKGTTVYFNIPYTQV